MGYFVTREGKGFAVFYESAKVPRRRVRRKELGDLGFGACRSIDDAKAVKDALNAQERLRRIADRENASRVRADDIRRGAEALLPEPFLSEFERELSYRKIRATHWETAKRAVTAMREPPERWRLASSRFFEFIRSNSLSLDYCNTLRRAVNEWGYFVSERLGKPFRPIAPAVGADKTAILRAYERYRPGSKGRGRGRPSGRLSFDLLERFRDRFADDEYRWLYVSVAFGLRPDELEVSLKDPARHAVRNRDRQTFLHVYQQKAERFEVNPLRRWKKIPVKTPEQSKALEYLRAGGLKKPPRSSFTGMLDFRGRKITHYGGRKEFFPAMMKRFGEAEASRWLGHRSLDTARKHYDDPTADAPDGEDEVG